MVLLLALLVQGVAVKFMILSSMLAGPVAAAVTTGTAFVFGYAYLLPKDLSNLVFGSSPDTLVSPIVQVSPWIHTGHPCIAHCAGESMDSHWTPLYRPLCR
jgi:hypothetical protein